MALDPERVSLAFPERWFCYKKVNEEWGANQRVVLLLVILSPRNLPFG